MKISQKLSASSWLLSAALLLAGLSACGSRGMDSDKEGIYIEPYALLSGKKFSLIRYDQLELYFPVVGKTKFENDWHNARDGGKRQHVGNDLMAKKMTPVVAVADGVVTWVHAKKGGECCYLGIQHESQGFTYESRYIHLNNDTPGTDDGKAIGIAAGIRKGVRVKAGQLIGWVGDSGNAESTGAHLHFEIRDEYGNAVNPYEILLRAVRLDRVLYDEQPDTKKLKTADEQSDLSEATAQSLGDR